jgi:UDP-N-acetylmuramoyl-L-alanyl-D-glutamate--2,6-diaminopimelate ligase
MATWTGLDLLQDQRRLRVLGITGTNGKSTFVFMTRALLTAAGFPTAMIGTVEYDLVGRKIPAPLTTPAAVQLSEYLVEAAGAGARFATMEVSSISLDQRRVDGIDFAVAVFSNLTGDHLDYHGTMANYLAAKKRLFDGLKPDATAVINTDDPAADALIANCRARTLRYGFNDRADLRAEPLESSAGGTRFLLHFGATAMEMTTALAGRHNIYNAMAAAGAMLAVGLDLETIRAGLATVRRVPGRLERVGGPDAGVNIFVDYAHTDDALDNVLRAVRPLTAGRLWCVFGCGGDRDRTKRPRMAAVAARLADAVVVTSDNPRTEDPKTIIDEILRGLPADRAPAALVEPDRAAAIHTAVARAAAGDTVLIAGKGHEDYQIIGTEKIHFDDVEVARAALRLRLGER